MGIKNYWVGILGQVVVLIKRFTRDKVSLFFTFLFPLLFLFIFGTIFNNSTTKFDVAIINHSNTEFAKQFVKQALKSKVNGLHIKDVKDLADAKEKMKRSALDGIIELPAEFGKMDEKGKIVAGHGEFNVLYSKGSEQAGSILTAILSQVADQVNKFWGHPAPPLKVTAKTVGDEKLKTFDYTFTGLIAFSLLSMGVFGLANIMPGEKKQGSYRRLRAAPFTSGQLIIANAITYTLIALISVVTMILTGIFLFHFNMRGSWLLFTLFATLGSIMMVGFGLMIGGWAQNESQSSPISNLVSFPMMFLSGVFFPAYLFPEWLQSISKFIPITPLVDSFRLIMTENAGLMDLTGQLTALVVWIVIVYAAAIKIFRWE